MSLDRSNGQHDLVKLAGAKRQARGSSLAFRRAACVKPADIKQVHRETTQRNRISPRERAWNLRLENVPER